MVILFKVIMRVTLLGSFPGGFALVELNRLAIDRVK